MSNWISGRGEEISVRCLRSRRRGDRCALPGRHVCQHGAATRSRDRVRCSHAETQQARNGGTWQSLRRGPRVHACAMRASGADWTDPAGQTATLAADQNAEARGRICAETDQCHATCRLSQRSGERDRSAATHRVTALTIAQKRPARGRAGRHARAELRTRPAARSSALMHSWSDHPV